MSPSQQHLGPTLAFPPLSTCKGLPKRASETEVSVWDAGMFRLPATPASSSCSLHMLGSAAEPVVSPHIIPAVESKLVSSFSGATIQGSSWPCAGS